MVDLAEKIAYVDATLESADSILSRPDVVERLGDRAGTLLADLDRLVPVLSPDDAEKIPGILEPDAVPLLVISPGEAFHFGTGAGVDQFSTRQVRSVERMISEWEPRDYTFEQILAGLLAARKLHSGDPPQDTKHEFRKGIKASLYSEDTIIGADELKRQLTLTKFPKAKIVHISFRQLVTSYVSRGQTGGDPDILLHELTHLDQHEHTPINPYGSQQEIDTLALRNELEAYFVGATIMAAILGKDVNDIDVDGKVKNPNVLVERARLASPQLDPRDPFRPNPFVLKLLDVYDLGVDKLAEDRVDLDVVMKRFGIPNSDDLAKKQPARNKRYTPPKR